MISKGRSIHGVCKLMSGIGEGDTLSTSCTLAALASASAVAITASPVFCLSTYRARTKVMMMVICMSNKYILYGNHNSRGMLNMMYAINRIEIK
jgi:methyl coenzyme M reductase subunit C